MDQDREAQIRQKAHEIWEAEGRPSGQAERHWRMAREHLGEILPVEAARDAPPAGKARKHRRGG
ncbi:MULTISPECIES: DUF2934 domain-containing protein [Pseudomonas]|uniref:DUF2934 domain-containing protein n=1 Tax=Pseudomonas TaxID=286 RepID=UPI000D701141|nr:MULTISPECIES: DUF2934 domain-containing protein [unclassified Pseudomonas]PWU30335.1 DUF2934 domain-containing protein [Pseudomonas sp. RW407]